MTHFEMIDICKTAIFNTEYAKKYIDRLYFCPPKAGRELHDIELYFTTIDNPEYVETRDFCININEVIGIAKTNPEFPFVLLKHITSPKELKGIVIELPFPTFSSQMQNAIATLAIEDMYLSNDFLDELKKIDMGKKSTEELRQEVINKYAR